MEKILVIDAKNYDSSMKEILRLSVRGVILIDGKLLLLEDSFGEVKLPGGGIEKGENDIQALIREVKEETGYTVIEESIVPFGEVEEKRLSTKEPMIWHQFNRLYFCSVYPEQGETKYTPHEIRFGFHTVLYSIDDAIRHNEEMFICEGRKAINQREYQCLLEIKKYFDKKEVF